MANYIYEGVPYTRFYAGIGGSGAGGAGISYSSNTRVLDDSYIILEGAEYFQILDPGEEHREIKISSSWAGQIINESNGEKALILVDFDDNILATLGQETNLKSVLVWHNGEEFYVQQTGLFQQNTSWNFGGGGASLTNTQQSLMKLMLKRGF